MFHCVYDPGLALFLSETEAPPESPELHPALVLALGVGLLAFGNLCLMALA